MVEKLLEAVPGIRGKSKEAVRNALLRVQIYCSINSNSDPIRVSKQLYIAQVLEKLILGSNMLFEEEVEIKEVAVRKRGRKK